MVGGIDRRFHRLGAVDCPRFCKGGSIGDLTYCVTGSLAVHNAGDHSSTRIFFHAARAFAVCEAHFGTIRANIPCIGQLPVVGVLLAQLEHFLAPHRFHFIIVCIDDGASIGGKRILRIPRAGRLGDHEQLVGSTHGARIAVGNVHQIVSAGGLHDVPHMAAGAGAAVHHAAYAVAVDLLIKIAQVAQVLEGLGIAFADDVGGRIAVKHPDQLPGVAVGGVGGIIRSGVVVGNEIADLLHVGAELFFIALVCMLVHDGLRLADGSSRSAGLGSIGRVTRTIFGSHSKRNTEILERIRMYVAGQHTAAAAIA